jgi:uncharacterized protein
MGIQSVVRWFLPREDHFYDYIEGQAEVAHEGALALLGFKEGKSPEAVRHAVQELEHAGDKISHDLEEALARTFVTPMDREDLQRLSGELDDILDLTNGAVRQADLLGVGQPTEPMAHLMDILVGCTEVLRHAVPKLRKHAYNEILEDAKTVRKLEKDADVVFRSAMSALFQDPTVDAKKLIREREVLEDLENAIDRCQRVGRTLANLAVKHG